jgi:hypothetical protein
MRVLVITKVSKEIDDQKLPIDIAADAEAFQAMGAFMGELTESGVFVTGTGLRPSRFGKRVLLDGSKVTVKDGPFTETKELIASFTVLEVTSMEHALEIVKRTPKVNKGPTEVEIRPFLEMEDFDFGAPPPAGEKAAWEKMTGQEA